MTDDVGEVLIVISVCLGARWGLSGKKSRHWTDSVFVRTLSCSLEIFEGGGWGVWPPVVPDSSHYRGPSAVLQNAVDLNPPADRIPHTSSRHALPGRAALMQWHRSTHGTNSSRAERPPRAIFTFTSVRLT